MNCYLITGCPRSGTSITAAIVAQLGLYLGDHFAPADSLNETGYHEDLAFAGAIAPYVQFPDNYTPVSYANPDLHYADNMRDRILDRTLFQPGDWGFKNNYIAVPDALAAFLKYCTCPVHGIVVNRDPASSAQSYLNYAQNVQPPRQATTLAVLQNAVAAHNAFLTSFAAAIQAQRGRVLNVQFETLAATPQPVVQQIADFLGLPYSDAATALVSPGLVNY